MRWFVAIQLRDGRIAARLTQAEAAQEFGCSPQTIYYWERGERHPRKGEVYQIAETYALDDYSKRYLKMILDKKDTERLEADARFHALTLAKAELHSGIIFKYEPHLVPGPLQTRDYHFLVPQAAEQLSDPEAERGWKSKERRKTGIKQRKVKPSIRYLVGDSAMHLLRRLPPEVARELLEEMLGQEENSNIDIRVIQDFHPARSTPFDIFEPGGSATAPPEFVYSETFHGSWCIEEDSVVARYHVAGQAMWQLGIPLKEFLNEYCRDLLA
jgi:transcriptional regulator with XRE-family HTH domain